jgi:hypothetical protein
MPEATIHQQPAIGLMVSAAAGLFVLPPDCATTVTIDAAAVLLTPSAVTVNVLDPTRLAKLFELEDDWDGEGAPKPSRPALQRADAVVRWAHESGLVMTDVDADVLGGVAVWLRADPMSPVRSAWIACMNNGQDTLVLSEARDVTGHAPWDASDAAKATILDFLRGARRDQARA